MTTAPLAPTEAYVLLNPETSSSAEAFKIGFLALVATRVLKIAMVERRRLLRTKSVPVTTVIGKPPTEKLAAEIVMIVHRAEATEIGVDLRAIGRSAVTSFGPGLAGIKANVILPSLVSRGLLTVETYRRAWLFNMIRHHYTPEGLAERQRIESTLSRARRLPALLSSNPQEAAAVILAAGPLLLLLPELKTHYGALAALDRAATADIGGGDGFVTTSDQHHGLDAHGHSGAMDFGSFDFGSFDAGALDIDFSSFDASFDSSISDSGGDGGSDSGGGHH